MVSVLYCFGVVLLIFPFVSVLIGRVFFSLLLICYESFFLRPWFVCHHRNVHPDCVQEYISTVAFLSYEGSIQHLDSLVESDIFDLSKAGHARSLARGWAQDRKRALLSEQGRAMTVKLFSAIGNVNPYSASAIIGSFGHLSVFDEELQTSVVETLKQMREGVKSQKGLVNNLNIILAPYE